MWHHNAYILQPTPHNVAEKILPNTKYKSLLIVKVDLINKALQCCVKPV